MLQFERSPVLLALGLLPLIYWALRRRRTAAVPFPGIHGIESIPRTFRQRCLGLLPLLRFLSIGLLIGAAAEPRWNAGREVSRGLAIQLVVDRSSSMDSRDMEMDGTLSTRLDVVKKVGYDFVFGNGAGLTGRPTDMIGLVAFAADPITIVPLTLSHESVRAAIKGLQVADSNSDGTAIGDAIAQASAKLQVASSAAPRGAIRSKIIVLITDGENNLGMRTPEEAAELARKWDVKIYVIAIRPNDSHDVMGQLEMLTSLEATLAKPTGGLVRSVASGSALESIFADIDRLEPSDLAEVKLDDGNRGVMAFVIAGLFALALEFLLSFTWLRRIP